jgi:hypothetical protein
MAFNVYKWRRDQLLVENQYYGDITGETSKGVLQAFLKDLEKEQNPTPEEIKQIERLKGEIAKLNENEDSSSVITKKLKDITWEDVKGLYTPTNQPGVFRGMDDRDMFSDQWRESTLEDWKNNLRKHFPSADGFDVEIDRDAKKVTINNKEYNDTIDRYNSQIQATQDKTSRRYQGD